MCKLLIIDLRSEVFLILLQNLLVYQILVLFYPLLTGHFHQFPGRGVPIWPVLVGHALRRVVTTGAQATHVGVLGRRSLGKGVVASAQAEAEDQGRHRRRTGLALAAFPAAVGVVGGSFEEEKAAEIFFSPSRGPSRGFFLNRLRSRTARRSRFRAGQLGQIESQISPGHWRVRR